MSPALDKCCDVQAGFGLVHGQFRFDSMTVMPSMIVTASGFGSHMMHSLLSLTLSCEECDCAPFSWQILIINRCGHDKQRLIVFLRNLHKTNSILDCGKQASVLA